MGIFGKKKDNEFDGLHNENLFTDEDDIFIPAGQRRNGTHRVGQGNISAPHALTADEVAVSRSIDEIPMKHPQPDSVYKRMLEREKQHTEASMDDDYVPSWAAEVNKEKASPKSDFTAQPGSDDISSSSNKPQAAAPAKAAAKPQTEPLPSRSAATDAFLEKCRSAVAKASGEDVGAYSSEKYSLDTGSVKREYRPKESSVEAPKTRSVDEIISMLRGEQPSSAASEPSAAPVTKQPDTAIESTADKAGIRTEGKTEPVQAAASEKKLTVEVIPTDSDSDIMRTTRMAKPDGDVRIYGKVVRGTVLQHTPDGDIDVSQLVKSAKEAETEADAKTIMFDNLGDIISKRADSDTLNADMSDYDDGFSDDDDDFDYEDTPYYETDDKALGGIEDYKTLNDASKLKLKLLGEKSHNKIIAVFTAVVAVISLVFATPIFKMLPKATVGMIDLILLLAAVLFNYDIFKDLKNIADKRPKFDSCVAVTSVAALLQSAVSTFACDGKYSGFATAAVILLSVNRFAHLAKSTRILRGLEKIATSSVKRGVASIKGKNAETVASGSVDTEAMVLCGRKTVNVRDYLKNCGYDSPFEHRLMPLFVTAVAVALIGGVISAYFGGVGLGFTVFEAVLLCAFPASAALICELPMYLAAKKADSYGAVIAGYKGAYELNLANIVAVTTADLFPEGTVSLYNMKPLGSNEIGRTLVDAGAVANAAGSPLAPIFKEIIGKDAERQYPKVNGVQYEDKMGISGWIGERTILIGNRNMLQGHNVQVPAAAVDQKVLRAGYFPVYIAIDGVPCLLLIVKYEADENIARELQILCSTGMTVVVEPKDPNASTEMLCDYFGLPDDALKVMNHNGRTVYGSLTSPIESMSAPAAYGKNVCGFFSSVSSAVSLSGIYAVLKAIFIIAAALGAFLLVYLCLTSKFNLITGLTVAGFQLAFTVVSAIVAKLRTRR